MLASATNMTIIVHSRLYVNYDLCQRLFLFLNVNRLYELARERAVLSTRICTPKILVSNGQERPSKNSGLDFKTSQVVRISINCTRFKAQWITLA